jgi:TrmH family RNA methyltransferase
MIISTQNQLVKYLVRLSSEKKFRQEEGKFLAEGRQLVAEALRDLAAGQLEKVFYSSEILGRPQTSEFLDQCRNKKIPTEEFSAAVFKKISTTESPQGVAALCHQNLEKWSGVGRQKFFLLLENLQDPGNLGTVLRTAEAAGVDLVIISEDSVDPYNPKTVRSSMGSIFRLPVVRGNLKSLIDNLKKAGVTVLATSSRKGIPYDKITYNFPLALVFGQEAAGLSREILNLADEIISIPLLGKVESLNVAAVAAVLLFEVKKLL